jgi:quercetin dioxygenase-like cupin family protein
MRAAHLDDLDAIELADGFVWRPVRRRFGITAFGVNAYTPGATGQVVEDHTEEHGGHEELYVVLRGRVRFTIAGDEHELGQGQLVCIRDPQLRRSAVALTDDAAVLAVGGTPGAAHEVSAWETLFAAAPAMQAGDWDTAIRLHADALDERPDDARLLFNLACMEARGGRPDDALAHLRRAVELDPQCAEHAATDTDFDTIRDAPGFPLPPAGD